MLAEMFHAVVASALQHDFGGERTVKIVDVQVVLLTGPCTNDRFLSEVRQTRSAAFVEIHTDSEHKGLGETYAGYFCPEIIPAVVDFFAPILIGRDVDDIPALWQRKV
jgi:L-alanine-DL-glutamate epimerase-like enolase superfamily enzyme